ncbi:glutathione S-transferase [Rhodoblastus acidophilus]|uniref:Glutathione S-transferase n=1 Tax=Candidatus Rhodoblastus alkanivorans TaxID=2954117 RepID=A0ABS9ZAS0_9HYPH|nr:glutathione S-transferase [Candidatus Rhodoblastus alkanivorans]MCI4677794.1 glutathione S-transferase [Candidatus Rhodoblastus alkanivorans]MCI4684708.1 glutathione S-transferase [Candidatus Rhodoblastus alkanivorans]MDI4642030.1 glutathione S-transferase [Rhodoblastus acidophilus]
MKLYDSPVAPNPRRVRIFLAEKGVSVPKETVDLAKLEQKDPAFAEINPLQRIPVLELDSGEFLSETVAICRYFEEIQPDPPLFGRDPLEKARVEMWQRRAELEFFFPIAWAFRHSHPAMVEMEKPQIPELVALNRPRAVAFARFLDSELARRPFLAGDAFSIADITALVAADFAKPARIVFPDDLIHFARWRADVSARPSAAA